MGRLKDSIIDCPACLNERVGDRPLQPNCPTCKGHGFVYKEDRFNVIRAALKYRVKVEERRDKDGNFFRYDAFRPGDRYPFASATNYATAESAIEAAKGMVELDRDPAKPLYVREVEL